jgi:error-prone DNA polymerase
LIGTPRHLSQHPGGFVLARDRLDALVPIEPAAMADRQVIEWEKDDIEELKFMKVDVLGVGMLGCMRRAFDLLGDHKGIAMDLSSPALQDDDEATFEMIRRADTLGVFQIESRAQMSMLPPNEAQGVLRPRDRGRDRPAPARSRATWLHPTALREGLRSRSIPKPNPGSAREDARVPHFQEQG